jgi:hypothetical protein
MKEAVWEPAHLSCGTNAASQQSIATDRVGAGKRNAWWTMDTLAWRALRLLIKRAQPDIPHADLAGLALDFESDQACLIVH